MPSLILTLSTWSFSYQDKGPFLLWPSPWRLTWHFPSPCFQLWCPSSASRQGCGSSATLFSDLTSSFLRPLPGTEDRTKKAKASLQITLSCQCLTGLQGLSRIHFLPKAFPALWTVALSSSSKCPLFSFSKTHSQHLSYSTIYYGLLLYLDAGTIHTLILLSQRLAPCMVYSQ